ncbi:GNAT family N-acetyltransferase [Paenibacillus sacheonensis]|uniref:GNAT family N-acetyltransferase n=1 Tax=Paenibacillus sacheonensis TaxID=742054 RepID=A0A7X4YTM3_9BACL|nr:GNAT family N-acetyltransferase [Paenibacillus sacheonensis]MBM7568532.1 RimJ/RimL family protein N-acetyltransferase [Paenibacillus sacheonensis]NBC72357.1 GNAT family N-acetyltransferase [Paenibacillus sacheonensis]
MKDWYAGEIVLENERVKLVPFSSDYAEGLRRIITDPELHAFAGIIVRGEDDLQAYIAEALASRDAGTHYPFIVVDRQTGEVAGSTRFGHIQFGAKRLEIGWTWYGEAYRGTGLNRAVKYELLRYAFGTLGFNRVQFSVDAENLRSRRAVLKLGAKQEGLFRCNYENAEGECRDDVYFSIIKKEWPELRRTVFREFG